MSGTPVTTRNQQARQSGVPKWLRRHAARHGIGVDEICQTHKQFPVSKLDHWADRTKKLLEKLR